MPLVLFLNVLVAFRAATDGVMTFCDRLKNCGGRFETDGTGRTYYACLKVLGTSSFISFIYFSFWKAELVIIGFDIEPFYRICTFFYAEEASTGAAGGASVNSGFFTCCGSYGSGMMSLLLVFLKTFVFCEGICC